MGREGGWAEGGWAVRGEGGGVPVPTPERAFSAFTVTPSSPNNSWNSVSTETSTTQSSRRSPLVAGGQEGQADDAAMGGRSRDGVCVCGQKKGSQKTRPPRRQPWCERVTEAGLGAQEGLAEKGGGQPAYVL
jgi:hypothetical protein